ncbi:MAG: ABC transporter substrate-binding protein, partial [Thermodesulfobacteriota bacterium]
MRKFSILMVMVFMISIFTVSMAMAQAKPAAKEPIKFGAIYDFAGGCHMYSESAITGIKLGFEEINAKGGILGRKLEYFVRDTEGKTDVGQRETKDLILREKVNFIMGPCSSGVGLAMQVVHSESKIIRIAGIANTEAQVVDKFTPYIFQIVPNTYMEATANTRYLNKKFPKAKKFCTIGPDYEFGRREEGAFTDEIKKLVPDAEIL